MKKSILVLCALLLQITSASAGVITDGKTGKKIIVDFNAAAKILTFDATDAGEGKASLQFWRYHRNAADVKIPLMFLTTMVVENNAQEGPADVWRYVGAYLIPVVNIPTWIATSADLAFLPLRFPFKIISNARIKRAMRAVAAAGAPGAEITVKHCVFKEILKIVFYVPEES